MRKPSKTGSKSRKKVGSKKATAKPARTTKGRTGPARAKAASKPASTPRPRARPAPAQEPARGVYEPSPITGQGWPPFRYSPPA